MERDQPSRSSRQAGWQGGQPASLAPCVPLSPNTTCLLICIALTDMFSVSGPPSSRTATQHSPRVFRPIVQMCRTMAARTWLRVGASCLSVCSRTVSLHSNSPYLRMWFPWPNAGFDMSSKEAWTTSTTYDATREPHVRYNTYRDSAPIIISVPLSPECGILVADVDPI